MIEHTASYRGLLGTVVDLRIRARDERAAAHAERAAFATIVELQRVFSAFDDDSDLCRWRDGRAEASPRLAAVLAAAARWHEASGGAFNPLAGRVAAVWQRAADSGEAPPPELLARLAHEIATLPWTAGGDRVVRTGPTDDVVLNAIAKGEIVDRALDAAIVVDGVDAVVVNAGGDLAHRGTGSVSVGVEDPHRPFDNVAPLEVVDVSDAAIATSGSARRWVIVGGTRRSHVIDPRTGRPVDGTTSATVIAPDAARADVLATVANVLAPDEAVAWIDALVDIDPCACLIVTADRHVLRSRTWPCS